MHAALLTRPALQGAAGSISNLDGQSPLAKQACSTDTPPEFSPGERPPPYLRPLLTHRSSCRQPCWPWYRQRLPPGPHRAQTCATQQSNCECHDPTLKHHNCCWAQPPCSEVSRLLDCIKVNCKLRCTSDWKEISRTCARHKASKLVRIAGRA